MITRRMKVALLCVLTVGTCTVAVPAQAATPLPPNGSFVSYQGRAYTVAGKALLPIYAWASLGGPRRTTPITSAQYESRQTVADGTYIRSLPDGRIYVTVGQAPIYVSSWANVGGVHPTVDVDQKLVDAAKTNPNLPLTPHVSYRGTTPGPFVRDYTSGRVFEFVAGAPVFVTDWDAFGGVKPATTIDGYAVGYAGQGAWSFVRPAVPDKTVLAGITAPGKQVYLYLVAGGAPVYVPRTDHFPEPLIDPIRVDERSIESAGHGTRLNLLRPQPTDGTFLYGAKSFDAQKLEGTGQLFWIHSGAAIPVKDEKACAKADSYNDISTIERAGTGGVYNHLAKLPADHPQPPC